MTYLFLLVVMPNVLEALPDGVPVLIQKPMGLNLDKAKLIKEICHRKELQAAVNFQLRFSAVMQHSGMHFNVAY